MRFAKGGGKERRLSTLVTYPFIDGDFEAVQEFKRGAERAHLRALGKELHANVGVVGEEYRVAIAIEGE